MQVVYPELDDLWSVLPLRRDSQELSEPAVREHGTRLAGLGRTFVQLDEPASGHVDRDGETCLTEAQRFRSLPALRDIPGDAQGLQHLP